jgi:hypothetical protein
VVTSIRPSWTPARLDWTKSDHAFFGGTLIQNGKVLGSRNAFEDASNHLVQHLKARPGVFPPVADAA